MWHKPCRTFNPWCLCIKTRCLSDYFCQFPFLNHSGWVAHICISKLTIIGADNGLWPGRHQAITWTNVGILLIRTLGTHFHSRKCIWKCRPWNGISSQLYVYNSAHWDCCISHIPQVDFFTTVLLIRSIIVCIFSFHKSDGAGIWNSSPFKANTKAAGRRVQTIVTWWWTH